MFVRFLSLQSFPATANQAQSVQDAKERWLWHNASLAFKCDSERRQKTQSPKGSTEHIKLGNTQEEEKQQTPSPSSLRGVIGAERRHLGDTAELNQNNDGKNNVHKHKITRPKNLTTWTTKIKATTQKRQAIHKKQPKHKIHLNPNRN